MKLTTQEIGKIAQLARLELSEKEKQMYAEQLSVVLNYIEQLNEVDTENVAETCQVTGLKNITREDNAKNCDEETRAKIISAFPQNSGKLLKVKAVFE